MLCRASLISALLLSPVIAQQTWVVDCLGGPGVDFLDFPAAVAAASPNDTILVHRTCPSPLGDYTPAVIDKPLRVVGIDGFSGPGGVGAGGAVFGGALRVTGIGVGSECVLSNLFFVSTAADGGLDVDACDGRVLLEDCFVSVSVVPPQFDLRIEGCQDVVLHGCNVFLEDGPLRVTDSNVLLQGTGIQPVGSISPFAIGPGVALEQSRMVMVDSYVEGFPELVIPTINPGITLLDSELHVGPWSFLFGGMRQFAGRSPAYAQIGTAPSAVFVDPRAVVTSTFALTPPPTSVEMAVTVQGVTVAAQPFGVAVLGPTGSGLAVLAFGEYGPAVPTPFGELRLKPCAVDAIALGVLDAVTGEVEWAFDMPSGVPSGLALACQGLVLDANGDMSFAIPAPFAIAWELGLAP